MSEEAHGSGLERARDRRHDLRLGMEALEHALALPAAETGVWLAGVRAASSRLTTALQAHIDEVEGSDGLLSEIRLDEPRLGFLVDELNDEHSELLTACERLRGAIYDEAPDVRQIRRRAVTLLGRLAMHRQAGADLVYEAYQVDIGGQG